MAIIVPFYNQECMMVHSQTVAFIDCELGRTGEQLYRLICDYALQTKQKIVPVPRLDPNRRELLIILQTDDRGDELPPEEHATIRVGGSDVDTTFLAHKRHRRVVVVGDPEECAVDDDSDVAFVKRMHVISAIASWTPGLKELLGRPPFS